MTMHLEGPWLSMQGKKKGKQKFRSAAEAKRARELEQEWEALMKKYQPTKVSKMKTSKAEERTVVHREVERPKSLGEWITGPVSSKQAQKYTGDKIKGIGTMHKSNAVPVFSDEEAVSLASMRR